MNANIIYFTQFKWKHILSKQNADSCKYFEWGVARSSAELWRDRTRSAQWVPLRCNKHDLDLITVLLSYREPVLFPLGAAACDVGRNLLDSQSRGWRHETAGPVVELALWSTAEVKVSRSHSHSLFEEVQGVTLWKNVKSLSFVALSSHSLW